MNESIYYNVDRLHEAIGTDTAVFILSRMAGEGVPLERLHKLGLYKHLNAQTLGYAGDPNEEADRLNNPL